MPLRLGMAASNSITRTVTSSGVFLSTEATTTCPNSRAIKAVNRAKNRTTIKLPNRPGILPRIASLYSRMVCCGNRMPSRVSKINPRNPTPRPSRVRSGAPVSIDCVANRGRANTPTPITVLIRTAVACNRVIRRGRFIGHPPFPSSIWRRIARIDAGRAGYAETRLTSPAPGPLPGPD